MLQVSVSCVRRKHHTGTYTALKINYSTYAYCVTFDKATGRNVINT